jgi:hypothetical protein
MLQQNLNNFAFFDEDYVDSLAAFPPDGIWWNLRFAREPSQEFVGLRLSSI